MILPGFCFGLTQTIYSRSSREQYSSSEGGVGQVDMLTEAVTFQQQNSPQVGIVAIWKAEKNPLGLWTNVDRLCLAEQNIINYVV